MYVWVVENDGALSEGRTSLGVSGSIEIDLLFV